MRMLCLIMGTLTSMPLFAQPGTCHEEHSDEFNFWVGTWQVYAGNQYAGTNTITPILNGCVLQEHWVGANGNHGTSLNFYNPKLKKWQQDWVWANGTSVTFTGERRDRSMILSANRVNAKGEPFQQRITWTPHADGTVRQHGEGSKDEGKTWTTLFDLLYKRKDG